MNREWVWDKIFRLCWQHHGGMGHSFSREDVLEMTVDEAMYHLDREKDAARATTAAIQQARKEASDAGRKRGRRR